MRWWKVVSESYLAKRPARDVRLGEMGLYYRLVTGHSNGCLNGRGNVTRYQLT